MKMSKNEESIPKNCCSGCENPKVQSSVSADEFIAKTDSYWNPNRGEEYYATMDSCINPNFDTDFWINASRMMRTALNTGTVMSTDRSVKLGAVITTNPHHPNCQILARGSNHIATPILNRASDPESYHERPKKYYYTEHAVRDAIYRYLRGQERSKNGTALFCPWYACADCARAIVSAGIDRVYGYRPFLDKMLESSDANNTKWLDSIMAGYEILNAYGVYHCYLPFQIFDIQNDGTLGHPEIEVVIGGKRTKI